MVDNLIEKHERIIKELKNIKAGHDAEFAMAVYADLLISIIKTPLEKALSAQTNMQIADEININAVNIF